MLHDRSSSHHKVGGIVKYLRDKRLGYTACTPVDVRKFNQTKYLSALERSSLSHTFFALWHMPFILCGFTSPCLL